MRFFHVFSMLIIFAISLCGQSKTNTSFFSVSNRIKFSTHLYKTGDYIRAFDEYRALLTDTPNDTLRLASGLALRKLKRYDEAEDYFKGLFFFSKLSDFAKLEFLKTEFIRQNYANFHQLINNKTYLPELHKLELQRLLNYSLLVDTKFPLPDSSKFISVFQESKKSEIGNFYYKKQHPDKKSPLLAAALSTLIPGAGKFYTEDYSDGAVALIFTGLFYGLAAHNFAVDKNTKGAIFAGIGLFFHAGSVYGSATSAQIYNVGKQMEFQSKLIDYAVNQKYFLPDTEKKFIFKKQ